MSGAAPVLILTGPPGAGKTTVARILARRFERAVHVEADRFFTFIESGFVEPWKAESHGQNERVMRIVADAAAGYAAGGYFTVVEGIVLPRWFLEPLRHTLAAAGRAVAYAVLDVPLELCIARRDAIDRGVVEQLWREFSDLGELAEHRVDVGHRRPDAVADELAEQMDGRFLLTP